MIPHGAGAGRWAKAAPIKALFPDPAGPRMILDCRF